MANIIGLDQTNSASYLLNQYTKKYWSRKPRVASQINTIIYHGTGGTGPGKGGDWANKLVKYGYAGNFQGTQTELLIANYNYGIAKGGNDYYGTSGLYHYIISRDGKIWQVVDDLYWTQHALMGSYYHKQSIGIEMMNLKNDNQGSYTDAQYNSLKELTYELMGKYNITTIGGHGAGFAKVSSVKGYKVCPGPQFNWGGIKGWLTSRGYSYIVEDYSYNYVINLSGKYTIYGDIRAHLAPSVSKGEWITTITKTSEDKGDSDSDKKTSDEIKSDNTTDYSETNKGNENTDADIFSSDTRDYSSTGFESIAIEDMEIEYTMTSPTHPYVGQVKTITIPQTGLTVTECTSMEIDDKKCCKGPINYTWAVSGSPCPFALTSASPIIFVSGTGSLSPTATKITEDSTILLRQEDSGVCAGAWTVSGTPTACACTVKIKTAGQTKVKGE